MAAFDAFLDDLARRPPARLVLLGDVWDLLRRDPFGCAWETSGTIARLKDVAELVPVHVLPGNHDGHLHHLDGDRYEFDVVDDLTIESGGHRIRFRHGHEFDRLQLDAVTRWFEGPGDRGDMDPTRGRKDPVVAWGREVLQRGKRRLRAVRTDGGTETAFPRRERRAHDFLASIPEEKLVYGHTHAPYVHPNNVAANPGSWKTTTPVHGTYLVVENGRIGLFRHRTGRADERLDPA